MYLHANAKLGLAGRLALVRAIEERSVAEGGRGRLQRLAGDGASLVASLAGGRPSGRARCWIARAGRAARRGCSRAELQERICDCRRQTGWGPRLVAGATGFAHSTVWKVLQAGRALAPAAGRQGAGQQLRVALPGRSAAHGRRAATRASCGPATRVTGDRSQRIARLEQARRGSATTSRTRSSTTTPGSPTSSSTTTRRPRPSPASSSGRSPSSTSTGSPRSG